MSEKRRDFLKKLGVLSVGASVGNALSAGNSISESGLNRGNEPVKGKQVVNILQTTDVHCQIHPHDELFWENNKSVFRKTGGYAELATWVKQERKKEKNKREKQNYIYIIKQIKLLILQNKKKRKKKYKIEA